MKRIALVCLCCALLLPGGYAAAQSGAEAVLSGVDTSAFPDVSAYLDVRNPDGTFINGLTAESVSILEDGRNIPLTSLAEERVGLQITVAINASPTFAYRNNLGITRYAYMEEYLNQWADRQKENDLDDLSLITNSGIRQLHLKDALTWQTVFVSYKPDLKNVAPSLDLLGQAVDIARDFTPDTRMEKAVLYITPLPDFPLGGVLQDVINQANQAGAHIYVWMLASRASFSDPRAQELQELATATGGQFTGFSGAEEMPTITTLLEPLRSTYLLEYRSGANSSGQHNVAGQVLLSQQIVTSLPLTYSITLQPGVPVFVNPPGQVIRSTAERGADTLASLIPALQPLEIQMEFGDGYVRKLTRSVLFVDGSQVAENTTPPFERFKWDIREYHKDGTHLLKVQVTDELGMVSESRELPVEIAIVLPAINRWADFLNGGGIYLLLVVIFAAGIGAAIGFFRLQKQGGWAALLQRIGKVKPRRVPAAVKPAAPTAPPGRYRPAAEHAAVLALVSHDADSAAGYDIPLGERKFTIGSDRFLADVVLNVAGVEGRHTLIWHDVEGRYHASDATPGAGTLVNGQLAPSEGCLLRPGDEVQIGPVFYRYEEHPLHARSR
jgi:hypothetical protein